MKNQFTPLDCDDDVILLESDAFKVGRLRELLESEIKSKLQHHIYQHNSFNPGVSMQEFLSKISVGKRKVNLMEIQHNYITECQILTIGGHTWQKGKLKVEICISPVDPSESQLLLKFSSDEPTEYDSILDDICKIVSEN